MKQYKAVFFDWDGTAVASRRAVVDDVVVPMKKLLSKGIQLAIISGTTMENIAGGNLHNYFNTAELQNLFLGLGRGAYNYAYDKHGNPYIFEDAIPSKEELLAIHRTAYDIHEKLFSDYGFPTDIVFSRPNYCKIDLKVFSNRGDSLFFQDNELAQLKDLLQRYNMDIGLNELLRLAKDCGKKYGLMLSITTDAKYLEVGISNKSNNTDSIFQFLKKRDKSLMSLDCAFFGDEFVEMTEGIYGSDSFMITDLTREGDFFDVSEAGGMRPQGVKILGGGISRFRQFLEEQIVMNHM